MFRCCINDCSSCSWSGPGVYYFNFPKDSDKLLEWLENIPDKTTKVGRRSMICSRHFDNNYMWTPKKKGDHSAKHNYDSTGKCVLKPDAVPTLFDNSITKVNILKARYHCCIKNCNTTYTFESETCLFHFPKDPDELQKWLDNIPDKTFKLKKDSKICSKHFQDNCLLRKYAGSFVDDHICDISKQFLLKPDAVPTLFDYQLDDNANFDHEYEPPRKKMLKSIDDVIDDIKNISKNKEKIELRGWVIWESDNAITFLKICTTGIPYAICSFKICKNFKVEMYYGNYKINDEQISQIVGNTLLCEQYSKITSIIKYMDEKDIPICLAQKVEYIQNKISQIIIDNEELPTDVVKFLRSLSNNIESTVKES